MIIHTEGVVLKTLDFRETSRIATLFTRDYGKVRGVLKGIRTDPKKFGSQIDRFTVNDIVYYQYRHSDLHLISQCDLRVFFPLIQKDYKRNVAANYILELVDSIMPLEQKNLKVYQLMLDYLKSLEKTRDIDKLVHVFQIKILVLSGFRPHIDCCVHCQRKIDGRAKFSLKEGGLICSRCPVQEQDFTMISQGTVASMLHIEQAQWFQSMRLGLTSVSRRELKYILNNFLVYHLDKRLKTARYL